jgi:hypothetical protein
MSQQLAQSVAGNVVVLLSKTSAPVTGIAYTAVTCQFRKEGGSFASKSLTNLNFTELGNGVYTIGFTTAELNTLGSFVVVVQGASIDQSTTVAQIVAVPVSSTAPTVQTCTLTGSVTDLSGNPQPGIAVTAVPLGKPSIEQYSVALTDTGVSVTTDANGVFFITLARLADVEIFIPAVNYRRLITVPNTSSANLFTEIP